jgi:hypothetical protein
MRDGEPKRAASQGNQKVACIDQSERRPVSEQYVAGNPSAKRRDEREAKHSDEVKLIALVFSGGESTAQSSSEDAAEVDDEERGRDREVQRVWDKHRHYEG